MSTNKRKYIEKNNYRSNNDNKYIYFFYIKAFIKGEA